MGETGTAWLAAKPKSAVWQRQTPGNGQPGKFCNITDVSKKILGKTLSDFRPSVNLVSFPRTSLFPATLTKRDDISCRFAGRKVVKLACFIALAMTAARCRCTG